MASRMVNAVWPEEEESGLGSAWGWGTAASVIAPTGCRNQAPASYPSEGGHLSKWGLLSLELLPEADTEGARPVRYVIHGDGSANLLRAFRIVEDVSPPVEQVVNKQLGSDALVLAAGGDGGNSIRRLLAENAALRGSQVGLDARLILERPLYVRIYSEQRECIPCCGVALELRRGGQSCPGRRLGIRAVRDRAAIGIQRAAIVLCQLRIDERRTEVDTQAGERQPLDIRLDTFDA